MPGYKGLKGFPKDFRPPVQIIFLSLALGMLLSFLFWNFLPSRSNEAYGLVSVDKNIPDSRIGGLLENAGFKTYYSESSVKVYFDDFGRWKGFYLDRYREHIEPFDPRDDGYAEKLRSFFVDEEKRSFFIPLEAIWSWQAKKKIANALGPVPFSLAFMRPSGPLVFWLLLQAAASAGVLIAAKDKLRFSLQIPVIMAFALGGLPGIILAGLLAGFWMFLREPLGELFSKRPYGAFNERFKPYQWMLPWVVFYVFLYGFFLFLMDIPRLPAWAGFGCFIAVEFLTFAETKKAGKRRVFFTPVIILSLERRTPVFHQAMAVFVLAAFLGSLAFTFVSRLLPAPAINSAGIFSALPTVAEYQEHMAFEASFSFSPLGKTGGAYQHYNLGSDGLIEGAGSRVFSDLEIPPFPLEKLTRFLVNYYYNEGEDSRLFIKEWFSVIVMILLFVPSRLRTAKRNNRNKKDTMLLVRERTAA